MCCGIRISDSCVQGHELYQRKFEEILEFEGKFSLFFVNKIFINIVGKLASFQENKNFSAPTTLFFFVTLSYWMLRREDRPKFSRFFQKCLKLKISLKFFDSVLSTIAHCMYYYLQIKQSSVDDKFLLSTLHIESFTIFSTRQVRSSIACIWKLSVWLSSEDSKLVLL